MDHDLSGKTAVVTGGTSGIGRATAIELARRGAHVVVLGRDEGKGGKVEAELRALAGAGGFLRADLSLIGETRRTVATIEERLPTLDALILSAGGVDAGGTRTTEGLDKLFVTNFLHRIVLAQGLHGRLAAARGRLVLVGGDVPDLVPIDWRALEHARAFAGIGSLVQIQALALAMIQHLAREWSGDGIVVSAIHPGVVKTDLFRSARAPHERAIQFITELMASPPERPAKLLAWLAFSPEAAAMSGELFPTPGNWSRHRTLARDAAAVARVMAAARQALAELDTAAAAGG